MPQCTACVEAAGAAQARNSSCGLRHDQAAVSIPHTRAGANRPPVLAVVHGGRCIRYPPVEKPSFARRSTPRFNPPRARKCWPHRWSFSARGNNARAEQHKPGTIRLPSCLPAAHWTPAAAATGPDWRPAGKCLHMPTREPPAPVAHGAANHLVFRDATTMCRNCLTVNTSCSRRPDGHGCRERPRM